MMAAGEAALAANAAPGLVLDYIYRVLQSNVADTTPSLPDAPERVPSFSWNDLEALYPLYAALLEAVPILPTASTRRTAATAICQVIHPLIFHSMLAAMPRIPPVVEVVLIDLAIRDPVHCTTTIHSLQRLTNELGLNDAFSVHARCNLYVRLSALLKARIALCATRREHHQLSPLRRQQEAEDDDTDDATPSDVDVEVEAEEEVDEHGSNNDKQFIVSFKRRRCSCP